MIASLLTFLAVGLVSLVAVWIVLSVVGGLLGLTIGLASFLIFKVAPLMLLGWAVLKLVSKIRGGGALASADRRWLRGD